MSLLLYISYSSKLTEKEKLDIDTSILENRVAAIKFVKKVYGKGKVIVISTILGIFILVSTPQNAEGIGVLLTSPVARMRHSTQVVPSHAKITVEKQDKITFLKNERVFQNNQIYSDLAKNRTNTLDGLVELRSEDINALTKALFRIILLWALDQGHTPAEGFQPSQINPGFGQKVKYNQLHELL